MNREDFNMLDGDLIYFDNAATTLKPKCVSDVIYSYNNCHTSNIHRGDYDIAIKTDKLYDGVRDIVGKFVNCSSQEVIFNSGATMGMNMVVFGFFRKVLTSTDEVLVSKSEHASNLLPWIKLSEEIGFSIKFIELDDSYEISYSNILNSITSNTKVISIAHITNVVGDVRDVDLIGKLCKEKGIYFVVDGAQSVAHMKVDFKKSNMDFLVFSSHKMCGPTGVGVLVGKYEFLEMMDPIMYGGGMNYAFDSNLSYILKNVPIKFEAGTPNISGVIGLGRAIEYLSFIGMDVISKYEVSLCKYLISKLSLNKKVILYNKNCSSGIVSFNIEGVSSMDVADYLNCFNICVRAGNHCAKVLKDDFKINNTVRISLYFYNTIDEINKLLDVLEKCDKIFEVAI